MFIIETNCESKNIKIGWLFSLGGVNILTPSSIGPAVDDILLDIKTRSSGFQFETKYKILKIKKYLKMDLENTRMK